jgi:hypothetical protein
MKARLLFSALACAFVNIALLHADPTPDLASQIQTAKTAIANKVAGNAPAKDDKQSARDLRPSRRAALFPARRFSQRRRCFESNVSGAQKPGQKMECRPGLEGGPQPLRHSVGSALPTARAMTAP